MQNGAESVRHAFSAPAYRARSIAAGQWRWRAARSLALLAAAWAVLPGRCRAIDVIMSIPVYEWELVWMDWRNPNYKMGSIWRPTMIERYDHVDFPGALNRKVDGYDIRDELPTTFDVLYFGDVFMPGHQPPNFVGTVLVAADLPKCPLGVPCFERDRTMARFKDLLYVTPDKNIFERIWESKLEQCVDQTAVGVPMLCSSDFAAKGLCKAESGFAFGEIPISIQRPVCPNDYYVLGHIALREANGTHPAEIPSPHYKCLHESLLRNGAWQTAPSFTGSQPKTSPWNPTLKSLKWKGDLSLWQTDCSQPNCNRDFCFDHFSRGLFYASSNENVPNNQLTGTTAAAPVLRAPKCFTLFRDCVGNDGKGTNIGDNWDSISDCDSENGKSAAGVPNPGIFRVIPSGIPNVYSTPVKLVFEVDRHMCNEIRSKKDDINPNGFGTLTVNGVSAQWVSIADVQTWCEIVVNLPLDGTIKPGPARIEIRSMRESRQGILKKDDGSCAAWDYCRTIGRSVGRLYVYKDPGADASIVEPRTVNNNECNLFLLVRMPPYAAALLYNTNTFCNWRQTGAAADGGTADGVYMGSDWRVAEQPAFIKYDHLGIVGVQCYVPQLTQENIYLQISYNANRDGQGQYHDISATLTRYGNPWSAIATDGALRLYGITPKSGPQSGGTLITLFGQYFSNYCEPGGHCNRIQCHFTYPKAGGFTLYAVDATFISDKMLKCISPRTVLQVWDVKLQISVDMNRACSTPADDKKRYNEFDFIYQTDDTETAIPAEAPRSADVTLVNPFHRLQGIWHKCQTNSSLPHFVDCAMWSGLSKNDTFNKETKEHDPALRDSKINNLGHYSCLAGFADERGVQTDNKYPVWCIRALPVNAASSYIFTLTDPFHNIVMSALRPVPRNYPGFCHRTNHHFGWQKMSHNLDYRYFDFRDKNYSYGSEPVPGKITQGRNLIDRLWSTSAMHYTASYMRKEMHAIGEKYGFIDLGTIFSISFDFTLAQTFDEKALRRNQKCARPQADGAVYSGELGDEGAAGSFVNWTASPWTDGRASCSVDDRWPDRCEHTIVKSPNRDDDLGVMLTKPSTLKVVQPIVDEVVGCGRIRVGFNCSRFSLSQCVADLVERDINSARYRNTGSKQDYTSFEKWCAFIYPETAGPNNLDSKGWNASAPVEKDWRYLYRHSPCVRCQQAAEICGKLIGTPGLKWKDIGMDKPSTGTELQNTGLATDLLSNKVDFSRSELDAFQMPSLTFDDYIKVGDRYYQPADVVVDDVSNGIPGAPERRSLGDRDALVEITLGCFGSPEAAVEDECCDDAGDNIEAPPIRGACPRSLERCVRPPRDYLCAKDDNRDNICSDRVEAEWPLCAPRNLV